MSGAGRALALLVLTLAVGLLAACGASREPAPGRAPSAELEATAAALAQEVLRLRAENARLEERIATLTEPLTSTGSCPDVVREFYLTFVSGILYEVEQVSDEERQRLTQVIVFFESFCRLPEPGAGGPSGP